MPGVASPVVSTVSAKPVESLRERRQRLGVSQQTLAAAAACSISALRLYESGYSPARSTTRERVERALDELEGDSGQLIGQHSRATGPVRANRPAPTGCDRLQHERGVDLR